MSVSLWYDVLRTFMNSVWHWPLTSISKLYFHHEFEPGKMSLLFDIGIPNFGILVYYHETWNILCKFLTLVWPWLLIYTSVAGGILCEFLLKVFTCLNLYCDVCTSLCTCIGNWCLGLKKSVIFRYQTCCKSKILSMFFNWNSLNIFPHKHVSFCHSTPQSLLFNNYRFVTSDLHIFWSFLITINLINRSIPREAYEYYWEFM